jgi:integrase
MRDNKGRRKGSRNKGYWFRDGRGWGVKGSDGRFIPLTNEAGDRLKDKNTPADVVKDAYARHLLTKKNPPQAVVGEGVTLEQVVSYYLSRAKDDGSRASTIEKRSDTLYDLCFGFPAKFRETETRKPRSKPTAADRIHPGYGRMLVADLRPFHLEDWLNAHKEDATKGFKGWISNTGRRTRLQAVKRALNRAAKGGLIPKDHGIRGMTVPKGRARVTYLSPEQEKALSAAACPAMQLALRVLVRTGMRPGCEFAEITAAHVVDHGDRLEIRFKADASKNNKARVVRIKEKWLIDLLREQIEKFPTGPLFRNSDGKPWIVNSMSRAFRRALDRAKKSGMTFDKDVCLYSCRHTFAKRALIGYWTGKPINMELLASLMGNTPAVCARHYADILKELSGVDELLWTAC